MLGFRGFIAIDVEANDKIERLIEDLKRVDARLRFVDPDKLHVTLKFLGETDEDLVEDIERCIEGSVRDLGPFTIKLHGVGVFPNDRRINVIWIGVKGDNLKRIFLHLDGCLEKLGFEREVRGFSPHLTVARVKGIGNRDSLLSIIRRYSDYDFGEQIVDRLKLKKSVLTRDGPIYSDVREVRMGGIDG